MTNPSSNEPSKTAGQFHSVKGSAVESVGDMTGSQSWVRAGKEEHARGEEEYKAAKDKGVSEGISDRAGGYKDSVAGAIKGDKSQQVAGNARKEKGQAQQELNQP